MENGRTARQELSERSILVLSCFLQNSHRSVLGLILLKALRLQLWEHQVWLQRERAQIETIFQVPTYRGSIYDRQGRLLAYSVPQHSLYADSEVVENPRQLANRLASILEESEASLEKKLSCGRKFVWLKRHLTDQQTFAIERLRARGLNLTEEYRRFYPFRQIAGHVIGFVGKDGMGLEGIEKSFDRVLRQGTTTYAQQRDGVRKYLWLNAEAPPEVKESFGVTLTIDAYIQYLCESELEKCIQKYRAASGEVVVMDPNTFEILAMANWPSFDPNLDGKRDADTWRNRSITRFFRTRFYLQGLSGECGPGGGTHSGERSGFLRKWKVRSGGPHDQGRAPLRMAHHS